MPKQTAKRMYAYVFFNYGKFLGRPMMTPTRLHTKCCYYSKPTKHTRTHAQVEAHHLPSEVDLKTFKNAFQ